MNSHLTAGISTFAVFVGICLFFYVSACSGKDFSKVTIGMTVKEAKSVAGFPEKVQEIPFFGVELYLYKEGVAVIQDNKVVNIMSSEEFIKMYEENPVDVQGTQNAFDEWTKKSGEIQKELDNLNYF